MEKCLQEALFALQGGKSMALSPLAGKPAPRDLLVNIPRLVTLYYSYRPDASDERR